MTAAYWTMHKASDGKPFYYDRVSGKSTWDRPADGLAVSSKSASVPPTLRHCGPSALPAVRTREQAADDPLCAGGRGGAFCCASQTIYLCSHPWVSCREMAYELSHALNVCRGLVQCRRQGMRVDDADCGYLGPPEVACSEYRASRWTGRCDNKPGEGCPEWHARWAVAACFPKDEHLEAHVRWARQKCAPTGEDAEMRDFRGTDQAARWAVD